MTPDKAVELLSYHSGTHPDIHSPKWTQGFLGMLRPYKGQLLSENYHEVMSCIRCLAPALREEQALPRSPISSIWGICHLARAWGLAPGGMLRRSDLISKKDIATLEEWLNVISYTTMSLLERAETEVAFELYSRKPRFRES
ncbi:MAG: hypothetical protein AAFV54_06440 [Pseudomonadota bacterium]